MTRCAPVLLLTLAVTLSSNAASTLPPARAADPAVPPFQAPLSAVDRFLLAVDRGELLVFGQKVGRATIRPIRVEYVYHLGTPEAPLVRIIAVFIPPLGVPECTSCRVWSISAVLNADGRLSDIEAQVSVE